ncbi:MAG TPA: fatty acid desaturase family protein [Terriglobales bacterium]|nr:fatty acid desaturase family protein [Terriglobales bacterium]
MIQPSDDWYRPDIPRKELRELMRRDDTKGLIDFGIWGLCLAASGYAAYLSVGSHWVIPAFFVYGTIYSSCDARWHECAHGTPFKTRWLNETFYLHSCLMNMKEGTFTRWSHTRHHTETIMVGIDPEIQVMRPANLTRVLLDFLWIPDAIHMFKVMIVHALGVPSKEAREFVPQSEWRKMFWWSRLYLLIYAGMIGWSIGARSWLPVLFFPLGRLYGGWLHQLFSLTQHAGLAENVHDHRLNSRTVRLNPVFRFLYFNMNYHIEHHMFPMVPFHALPSLHERVRSDLPYTYSGLVDAFREILPVLIRQSKDANYFLLRELPVRGEPGHLSPTEPPSDAQGISAVTRGGANYV